MNYNYFHQLPQNIIGKIISYNCKNDFFVMNDGAVKKIYYKDKFFNSGISLGEYIILDKIYLFSTDYKLKYVINHEYGHCKQSEKLGWLYLFVIGIPSFLRKIYHKLFHTRWDYDKKEKWYYSGFPEKQADELGGVER